MSEEILNSSEHTGSEESEITNLEEDFEDLQESTTFGLSETSSEYLDSKDSKLTPWSSIKSEVQLVKVILDVPDDRVFFEKINRAEIYIPEDLEITPVVQYQLNCHMYRTAPVSAVLKSLKSGAPLNLCDYSLSNVNVYFICQAIAGPPVARIKELILKNNKFDEVACITLAQVIIRSKTIEKLDLSNCLIGARGIEVLSEGIERSETLNYLSLANCNLHDTGGVTIANAVAINSHLKFLDISRNYLHNKSSLELKNMLLANTSLEVLKMGYNEHYPGKDASVRICGGLQKNEFIQEFDWSFSGLCGEGFARGISRFIKNSPCLRILNLENNYISSDDFAIINKGVAASQTLEELYIAQNSWSSDNVLELLGYYEKKANLQVLSVGEYSYVAEPVYNLAMQIRQNKPNAKIIFKGKLFPEPPRPVDFGLILLNRARFLAQKPKKPKLKRDMGHFFIQIQDVLGQEEYMKPEDFMMYLNDFGAKLDDDLKNGLVKGFTEKVLIGGKKRSKLLAKKMADMYLKLYPTERLPPPPTPPPPPPPKEKKGGKKK